MPVYNSGAGMDMSMGGSYDQVQRPPARASRLFGSPAVSRRPSCSSWSPNNDEYAEGVKRWAVPVVLEPLEWAGQRGFHPEM